MPLPLLFKAGAKLAPIAKNFVQNRLVRASAKAAIGGAAGGAAAFGAQSFANRMSAPPPRSPFGGRAGTSRMAAVGEKPKRKRINYTNVTALRRSVSRLKGFADLSERTMKQIARTLPAKTKRAARAAACRPKC